MLSKLKEIVEGWKNYTFENPIIEELAGDRAKICGECPEPVEGTFKVFDEPNLKFKDIQGLLCNACGCPLSAKTRSPNSVCPKNKWYKMKIQDLKIDLESVRTTLCKSKQELYLYADNNDMRTNINDCFSVVIDVVAKAEEKVYKSLGESDYQIQPYERLLYHKRLNDTRSKEKQLAFVQEQVNNQYNKLVSINKQTRFIDTDNTIVSLESSSFNNSVEAVNALRIMLTDIMDKTRYE